MENKLGAYIQKLMTTVLETDGDDFVKKLALSELSRIKVDLETFMIKNNVQDDNEKTIKKLLQEKKDGKK